MVVIHKPSDGGLLGSGSVQTEPLPAAAASKAQNVTLTNIGNATLILSSITASGDYSQANTCGSSVPALASCNISVTFKPTGIGSRSGVVTIIDNASPGTQTVTVSGTGTAVNLSTKHLSFPPQKVGTRSAPQVVTLTNVGTTALKINGIGISGIDAGDFSQHNACGKSVKAGGSCFITVTFTPTAQDQRTADLSINDNGGGSPQKVSMTGTGT
jgi:hypothetical protein